MERGLLLRGGGVFFSVLPALIIFRHSGRMTCRHRYQDSPLPKTSNWVEKFTKFGQLILIKIIKIAVDNLRASPPNFLAVGAIAPMESALMTESHLALERKFLELSLPGAKVPRSESSWERKFQELSLPGAKVPGNESFRQRKFHTMVLSLTGAKVLRSKSSIIPG